MKPNSKFNIVAILFLTAIFGQFVGVVFYPILPIMQHMLRISTESVQFIIPCYLAGFATTQIFAGFLSDRYGRRRVFLSGLLIASMSALLCSQATSISWILLGFFGEAVGIGCVVPIQSAIVHDVYNDNTSDQVFGIINIAVAAGGILSPILGGVIGTFLGWRWVFGLLVLIGFISWALSFIFLKETIKTKLIMRFSLSGLLQVAKKLCHHLPYARAVVISGFLSAGVTAFNTAAPFLLHRLHLIPHEIGILLSIPMGSMIFGLLISGLLVKRLGKERLILIGAIIALLGAVLMLGMSLFIFNVFAIFAQIIVIVFGVGLVTPSYWASALESFSDIAAVAASFLIFFQNLFGILTSSIVVYLPEHSQLPLSIVLTIVTGCAVIFKLRRVGVATTP